MSEKIEDTLRKEFGMEKGVNLITKDIEKTIAGLRIHENNKGDFDPERVKNTYKAYSFIYDRLGSLLKSYRNLTEYLKEKGYDVTKFHKIVSETTSYMDILPLR